MKSIVGLMILFLVLIGLGIAWEFYKYHDCKAVGHSTLYCIGKIGK